MAVPAFFSPTLTSFSQKYKNAKAFSILKHYSGKYPGS